MVRDDWQGKGVGTAMMQAVIDLADRWLNLTRIELTVFTDNEPAIALYRKFGFEIEGALRKYASAMESSRTLTRWRESNKHCSWIRIAFSMQFRGKARRSEA